MRLHTQSKFLGAYPIMQVNYKKINYNCANERHGHLASWTLRHGHYMSHDTYLFEG